VPPRIENHVRGDASEQSVDDRRDYAAAETRSRTEQRGLWDGGSP
jgi:hypothetical protein